MAEQLHRQSAFITQKCTIEYCRARAGFNWDLLLKEKPFLDSLETCRWEGYAAVASDVGLAFERLLRDALCEQPEALGRFLEAAYAAALHRYPEPPHLLGGWRGRIDAFAERLQRTQAGPPVEVHRIGLTSGEKIFAMLPIHPRLRAHDAEMIGNNICFNLVRGYEDLSRQIDQAAVAADIRRRYAVADDAGS